MERIGEVVSSVRDRLERRRTVYECGFCSLTFEEERGNCPACGFSAIRKVE